MKSIFTNKYATTQKKPKSKHTLHIIYNNKGLKKHLKMRLCYKLENVQMEHTLQSTQLFTQKQLWLLLTAMARIFQDVSKFCPNLSFQLDGKGSRPTGAFTLLPTRWFKGKTRVPSVRGSAYGIDIGPQNQGGAKLQWTHSSNCLTTVLSLLNTIYCRTKH